MSSLPREILVDVLRTLDRWTLDAVQITNRRFLQLIEELLSGVCLREITYAHFSSEEGRSSVSPVGRSELQMELSDAHEDFAGFFSAFLNALRNSWIADLCLVGIDFTPALATLVLEAPITAHELRVLTGSCAARTPAQLHGLILHFTPTKLVLGCRLLISQISDEFLRALSKNRVRHAWFTATKPVDGGAFSVTDDAVVDFCVQPGDSAEQGLDQLVPYAELSVSYGSFSKDLFKRLVEASAASTRTRPLRLALNPLRFEEEDLRDFGQHLSYIGSRGGLCEKRFYDFPGEQHGEVAPMDLQIRLERSPLSTGDRLIMVRARCPNSYFCSSDE